MNGLLDIDYEALIRKALEAQQPDKKSALQSGLLAAGMGMLANANRRGVEGIGAGGLMGLQAYQDNLQQQRKDPMQQIQMAQAIQGLQNSRMNQQAMQQWQSGFGAPQMAPQSDFAPGEAPGQVTPPRQPMAAQGSMPSAESLMQFMRSPNPTVAAQAKDYYDRLYKPFEVGAGAERHDPATGRVTRNVDPTKPTLLPNGTYGFAPGALESLTAQKRAEAEASEQAKADRDVITVPQGGRNVSMTRSQFVSGQGQAALPQALSAAVSEWEKDPTQTFKFTWTPPKEKLGVGMSKAEEAKAQQDALLPGELNKDLAQGMGKYSVESMAVGHKAAEEAAYNELPAIKEVRERIASGAFAGGGAETKTAILNQINGWFGTSIASPQLAQSQALNSALGKQLLANAKKLGANPTEADSKRIDNIVGKQGLSPEALLEIAAVQEKMAKQAIDRHNKRLDSMESSYKERGLPVDVIAGLRVKPPDMEPVKPKSSGNATLDAIEAEIRRRRGG